MDSLQLQVGTIASVASKDYMPLWLVSNRFGIITDKKSDFSTHVRITNSNRIGPAVSIYDGDDRGIYFDYGLDVYNNNSFKKNIIQEGYLKVRYKNLTFSGGRFKQIIGEVDHDLSSGSLGVSGNALPIPKLNLALEYTDIPFTNGWIQFKGMISHGWMGDEQFMKHAYLHEKNIYFRIGKNKLKLYGGIQHYAVWGGGRDDFFKTDNSFKGWLNVVTGIEANDGSVVNGSNPNRPGDQRGDIEFGAEWENDDIKFQLNNQTPFDSGQGIDIRNIDRLLSLNITNKKEGGILKKLTLEFIHTTQSNDFYVAQFRESYYNNGIYRTGWEYNRQIIGTPLFINRSRGSKYFDSIEPYDWDAPQSTIYANSNIIGNRILGGHVGALYQITDEITGKSLITYTKNYGYFGNNVFSPYKNQWYSLQEVSWTIPKTKLSFTGAIAYDFGDLSTNFGTLLGLQWQLRN
ncbi:MAG: capsule assembly Wzi family protein [Pedobacter sp.]|uniref:capsule assembly Wzi family protein n=1 Tax=Pedobacter sp. TaxID=1411316 RepID=UPI003390920B